MVKRFSLLSHGEGKLGRSRPTRISNAPQWASYPTIVQNATFFKIPKLIALKDGTFLAHFYIREDMNQVLEDIFSLGV